MPTTNRKRAFESQHVYTKGVSETKENNNNKKKNIEPSGLFTPMSKQTHTNVRAPAYTSTAKLKIKINLHI